MKTRLLVVLVLSAFGFALSTSPAVAQKPIPGIQQTSAWKSLQRYVSFLQVRRNQPAAGARKVIYRQTLTQRRDNTKTKVKALFRQTTNRLASQDDRWQRRQVNRIRTSQRRQVRRLQSSQSDRINSLQASQAAAVQRIGNRYAPKINRLANQRAKLRRKLAKTTSPAKRSSLTRQIGRLQNRINDLSNNRQDDINDVNDRYSIRISAVNDLYNAKIANVTARTRTLIDQADRAWRKTFRIQLRAAKTRRSSQFDLVKAVAMRGFGYIDSMPPPAPGP